jgi:hypothetical protein
MLKESGFQILEEGTAPATRYWLARKTPHASRLVAAVALQ